MFASLLLIIVWVAIGTYGDMCLKSAPGFASWRFAAGTALYASTAIMAVITFRRQPWGWVILAWNCISLAVGMLLSVAAFDERLTVRRAIAAVLLTTAILMAE